MRPLLAAIPLLVGFMATLAFNAGSNSTLREALAAACSPRPRVEIVVERRGTDLHATVRAGSGQIQQLRFWDDRQHPGAPTNTVIDIEGGPGDIRQAFTYNLPPNRTSVAFSFRPAMVGAPVQIPLVVVDDCGEWSTFVGGGAVAFPTVTSTPTVALTPTPTPTLTLTPTPTPTINPSQMTFTVRADLPFPGLDTGISLSAGERFNVTASGRATYGYEGAGCVGWPETDADGNRFLSGTVCSPKLDQNVTVVTAPLGTLIGRVGTGPWFAIGSNFTGTAASPGRLFLLYNEAYWSDDVGSYSVAVTRSPQLSPPWRILSLIYERTDVTVNDGGISRRVVAEMTADERKRATDAVTAFVHTDIAALTGGAMAPVLTIRYPGTLTSVSPLSCGWWPAPGDVASERDPLFDAVIMIWDQSGVDQATGQSFGLNCYGGLALDMGLGQTFLNIVVGAVGSDQRNIFKHEYGHSIAAYYDHAGTAPKPAVNNHINGADIRYVNCHSRADYIYQDETLANLIPNSMYNNESSFTRDYYSGHTALPSSGACLGITASAWASGGPVSRPGGQLRRVDMTPPNRTPIHGDPPTNR